MRFSKTLLATLVAFSSAAAMAAPTTITETGFQPVPQIVSNVTFFGGAATRSTGEYTITSTAPAGSFAAFCLEPFQNFTSPWVYDNSGAFTAAVADALSKLFTGANWQSWNFAADGVTTSAQRVGLGLAVWDIFIDGAFDLSSGNFTVTDDGVGGAGVAFAIASYAAGNTSLAPNLIRLTDPLKQDLVIAVPEPETYALMLAGLMAIGFVARRRKA